MTREEFDVYLKNLMAWIMMVFLYFLLMIKNLKWYIYGGI
jgi:hypothetical protein